jgi:hypothetical protein
LSARGKWVRTCLGLYWRAKNFRHVSLHALLRKAEKTQGTPSGAVTQTDGQQSGNSGSGQSGDIIKQFIHLQTLITSVTQLLQTGIQAVAPIFEQAPQIAAPLIAVAGEAAAGAAARADRIDLYWAGIASRSSKGGCAFTLNKRS